MKERPCNYDWKQWIPVYGVFEVFRDCYAGRPTLIDRFEDESKLKYIVRFYTSASYQGLCMLSASYGIYKLFDALL